jgi:hypothetical protein
MDSVSDAVVVSASLPRLSTSLLPLLNLTYSLRKLAVKFKSGHETCYNLHFGLFRLCSLADAPTSHASACIASAQKHKTLPRPRPVRPLALSSNLRMPFSRGQENALSFLQGQSFSCSRVLDLLTGDLIAFYLCIEIFYMGKAA